MALSRLARATRAIDKRGALLVYPIKNRSEPLSIWSELYPKSKMVWEWDAGADDRVAMIWSLREELSRSHQVVYVKWFQGRATFFSKARFVDMLSYLRAGEVSQRLTLKSAEALEILQADSPLSTKQLKAALGSEGRVFEAEYNRLMKPLWRHLLAVGFGEFDDSSFPSLGIGATSTLFEEEWAKSQTLSVAEAEHNLLEHLGPDNPFFKFAQKIVRTSALI